MQTCVSTAPGADGEEVTGRISWLSSFFVAFGPENVVFSLATSI